MGCSHNDTRRREEFGLGKEHGVESCFLLLDALFGATALSLFVRGNALTFWYKLRRSVALHSFPFLFLFLLFFVLELKRGHYQRRHVIVLISAPV